MHQYPFNNNVRAVLHNAVGAADTQIDVVKAVAPYKDAPDTNVSQPLGILSLTDSLSVPTKFEIVHYDNRIDNGTYWSYMGVIRARDGTSAQTFAAGNPVTQNVTRELLELPPPLYVTNDAGGSVGIGVASPTEKLDVDGSVSSSVGYMFTAEEDIGGAFAGSGIVLDWSTSHAKKATGIGNSSLDPMIDPSKPCRLQLLIEDTEVSPATWISDWPANVRWAEGTPLDEFGLLEFVSEPGDMHLIELWFNGAIYLGTLKTFRVP